MLFVFVTFLVNPISAGTDGYPSGTYGANRFSRLLLSAFIHYIALLKLSVTYKLRVGF